MCIQRLLHIQSCLLTALFFSITPEPSMSLETVTGSLLTNSFQIGIQLTKLSYKHAPFKT